MNLGAFQLRGIAFARDDNQDESQFVLLFHDAFLFVFLAAGKLCFLLTLSGLGSQWMTGFALERSLVVSYLASQLRQHVIYLFF